VKSVEKGAAGAARPQSEVFMQTQRESPYATGITLEQMRARVQRGLMTERNLLRLAWFVLGLAIIGLIGSVVLFLVGEISFDQALAAIFGVVISSVLSGAAAYGSGINVGLASSRLATSLPREDQEADAGERSGTHQDVHAPQ
jgi:hypothetical protein